MVPIHRLLAGKRLGPRKLLDLDPIRLISAPAADLFELFALGARTTWSELVLENRVACHGTAIAIAAKREMNTNGKIGEVVPADFPRLNSTICMAKHHGDRCVCQ